MSLIDGVYTNPGWTNEEAPPINATNLNDLSDGLVQTQSDVSDLSNSLTQTQSDVADLKSEMSLVNDAVYEYDEMSQATSASGWRLNESDGLCASDANYKLVKYAVTPGDVVKVVSDDRFQFQTVATVPSSLPNNRVGATYGVGTFLLKVPDTATYLIVSTPTAGNSSVYKSDAISPQVKSDINNSVNLGSLVWSRKSINVSTGGLEGTTNRILSPFIKVLGGEIVTVSGNASCLFVYKFDENLNYDTYETWIYANEYTVPNGGYIRLMVRSSSSNGDIAYGDIATQAARCTITRVMSQDVYDFTTRMNSISEGTQNLVDVSSFKSSEISVVDGVISGTATQFYTSFNSGVPINFKWESGEQYTVSFKAKNNTGAASSTGLIVGFMYTDETTSSINLPNNYTEYTEYALTSTSGKTVLYLFIRYANNGSYVWDIKDFQIEKGANRSEYLPAITATDHVARRMVSGSFVRGAFLGYSSYLGNAIPMVFSDGTTFMIDSFSSGAWGSVVADLSKLGITHLDYFMLTHWHGDHCGNMENLINNGYIDADTVVYLPQALDTSASYGLPYDWSAVVSNESTITTALTAAGITPVRPTEGQTIVIDGCTIEFWNTDHSGYYYGGSYFSNNYNDWSLCATLKTRTCVICFTADIGPTGMTKMADLGTMSKANIMTAPHHGWTSGSYANGYGLNTDFINAVHPDVVVTEDYSGNDQYYDTVGTAVQYWCESNGVGNYRTYLNGSIFFNVGSDGWSFENGCKAFVTPSAKWNWYNPVREIFIDAQIKLASQAYTNKYYATTTTAGLLHSAVQHIVGSDDGSKFYDFRLRVLDSSARNSFLEVLLTGYKYNTAAPATDTMRNNVISVSATNNVGTVAFNGVSGTAQVVVELVKEYTS